MAEMSATAHDSPDVETAYIVDSVGEMPTTFQSAMESSDAVRWKEVCDSEIASLLQNATWELVPLPKGRKSIGNRWFFRVKETKDGTIERFKARLVAKVFLQKHCIDYEDDPADEEDKAAADNDEDENGDSDEVEEKDFDSDDPLGVKNSVTLEGESDGFDREKLRQYELQKLRYYYATVTCDSVRTASTIFNQCDQLKYETSSNVLDLLYVSDDTTFTNIPKESCDNVPDRYKPTIFATLALQQTDVKLTWK